MATSGTLAVKVQRVWGDWHIRGGCASGGDIHASPFAVGGSR